MQPEVVHPDVPGASSVDCLGHLSQEQVEAIYQRYLARESATALKAEFGIVTSAKGLIRLLPPTSRVDRPCPNCQKPMLQERRALKRRQPSRLWCQVCDHQEDDREVNHCICDACASRRYRAVMGKLCTRPEGVPLAEVTLRQAVLLMAFFWPHNPYDTVPVVPAYSDAAWPFALTRDQHHLFMSELIGASLIRIDGWSPVAWAEEYLESGRIDMLHLLPNVKSDDGEWCSRFLLLHEIPARHEQNQYPNWQEELEHLGSELMADHAVAYLLHQCWQAGIMLTVSPAQRDLTRRLLDLWESEAVETVMDRALEVVFDRPRSEHQDVTIERLWQTIEGMFACIPQGSLDETPNGKRIFPAERVTMAICQVLRLPMPEAPNSHLGHLAY